VAIAATNKIEAASAGAGSSFTTAGTLSPVANNLYLAAVSNSANSGTALAPTSLSSSTGLTWVQIGTVTRSTFRVTVFRAMKASGLSSGTLTASFASSVPQTRIIVDELSGVAVTGSDGADAIVDVRTGTTSSNIALTVTLVVAGDACYGAFALDTASGHIGPGSAFTMLGDVSAGSPLASTEWRTPYFKDVKAVLTLGNSKDWLGVAVSLAQLVVVPPTAVVAPPATATASGAASIIRSFSSPAASAVAAFPAPRVTVFGRAPAAVATATALPPTKLKLTLKPPAAGANAQFLTPGVHGAAIINAPVARATAAVSTPVLRFPGSVGAVLAEATASAPAPRLKIKAAPPAARATAAMPVPRVTGFHVSATVARATAVMPAGGIVVPILKKIQAVSARASASMPTPNVVTNPLDPVDPTAPSDLMILIPVLEFVESP
jgi:hypothetical protein